MAEASLSKNKSILAPGQSGNFVYVGEMIPNEVTIKNTGINDEAPFTLESGEEGWKLYSNVKAGDTASLFVEWFNGFATFHNLSKTNDIEIGGNGIFPQGEEPS